MDSEAAPPAPDLVVDFSAGALQGPYARQATRAYADLVRTQEAAAVVRAFQARLDAFAEAAATKVIPASDPARASGPDRSRRRGGG